MLMHPAYNDNELMLDPVADAVEDRVEYCEATFAAFDDQWQTKLGIEFSKDPSFIPLGDGPLDDLDEIEEDDGSGGLNSTPDYDVHPPPG